MKKKRTAGRPAPIAKRIERAMRSTPVMIGICIVLFVGLVMLRKIVRPVMLYATDAQEIKQIERELKQVRDENARLKKQVDYLRTPEGAQTEARKLGYVRPGEVAYTLQKPAKVKSKQ